MQQSPSRIMAVILADAGRDDHVPGWCASLAEIANLPALLHVTQALETAGTSTILINAGNDEHARLVASRIESTGSRVITGSAESSLTESLSSLEGEAESSEDHVLVLCGIRPLMHTSTIRELIQKSQESGGPAILRSVRDQAGQPRAGSVFDGNETNVATDRDRDIQREQGDTVALCATIADLGRITTITADATDNSTASIVDQLVSAISGSVGVPTSMTCSHEEAHAVVTPSDRALVETSFQSRARQRAISDGAVLHGAETVWFSHDTVIEPGAVIEPVVVFGPGVTVKSTATIRAFSHLEGCVVGPGAVVGPHARLRPGTTVSENARVGNFVEIKASAIGVGTRVNHLSYVGDSQVDDGTNIGAGTITCNYDGVSKHPTIIGKNAFVGSHTTLVAPVKLGDGAMTAAGTVVTKDVPSDALAISRTPQQNKLGMARLLMEQLASVARFRGKQAKKSQD